MSDGSGGGAGDPGAGCSGDEGSGDGSNGEIPEGLGRRVGGEMGRD